jgi:hypothetical protein
VAGQRRREVERHHREAVWRREVEGTHRQAVERTRRGAGWRQAGVHRSHQVVAVESRAAAVAVAVACYSLVPPIDRLAQRNVVACALQRVNGHLPGPASLLSGPTHAI